MNATFVSLDQIGEVMRTVRRSRGVKIYELAKMIGSTPSTISDAENHNTMPRLETLKKIEQALGFTLCYCVLLHKDDYRRLVDFEDYEKEVQKIKDSR